MLKRNYVNSFERDEQYFCLRVMLEFIRMSDKRTKIPLKLHSGFIWNMMKNKISNLLKSMRMSEDGRADPRRKNS